MLEIEHWVTLLLALYHLAISCWNIYVSHAHLTERRTIEVDLLHRSVRSIRVNGIESLVVSRDLNTTHPATTTIVAVCTWVDHLCAIDRECVVVEALVLRDEGSTHPRAVLLLLQCCALHATTPSC